MSSPSRPGLPTPSVPDLVVQFDDFHITHPRQAGVIGGFRSSSESATTRALDGRLEKALPPTPSNDGPNSIPSSLRPGHGRAYQPPTLQYVGVHAPPVSMPTPMPHLPSPHLEQSLTMAYARSAPPDLNHHVYPSLQPDRDPRPPNFRHQYHSSVPSVATASPLASPKTFPRTRASSTPPSPSLSSATVNNTPTIQCYGMTKAGKRCTRLVKAPPLVSFFAPTTSEPVERFCFQHVREVLSQTGFYSRKVVGRWIEFADWIPKYLHADTQAALRIEMEKPPSSKDEPGYIYAYEIRDDRMPDEVKIKVGRAVKLVKRLDQWSKQCTSKEVILRGWWPGTVEDDGGENDTSLLRGRVKAGEKGPLCHRLERLVHIELADLAVHGPYLEPKFPNLDAKANLDAKVNASSPGRSPKPRKVRMPGKPCVDCGAIHKEIFTFRKAQKGKYKGREWEQIVQPVIAKWGRFVDGHV